MNTKGKKILFGGAALGFAALLLSGCNSFCSDTDASHYLFGYDSLNATFYENTDDAESFILETFSNDQNVIKENVKIENLSVQVFNEAKKGYDSFPYATNKDLVYGNLNTALSYIRPVYIKLDKASKDDKDVYSASYKYFGLSENTRSIISSAESAGNSIPNLIYWEKLDKITLQNIIKAANAGNYYKDTTIGNVTYSQLYGYSYADYVDYRKNGDHDGLLSKLLYGTDKDGFSSTYPGKEKSVLALYGYVKYFNAENPGDHFVNIKNWTNELIANGEISYDDAPSQGFMNSYQSTMQAKINALRTCITLDQGFYGSISNDPLTSTVLIEAKGANFWQGWGDAFAKHGFLEGLLVYPIASLVETFSHSFGMNGVGQILAVLLVTTIVRLFFMLITMPATISQQKMQYLQPEIAKLQAKYPNSNENQYEKQKLAQAQMALYKKNKVKPFLSIITLVVQFPLFICVWNAMQGSASLSRDAIFGLKLSDTVWNVLRNFSGWPGNPGWWTALVLILLMSAGQILAMFVPQWLNKKRMSQISMTNKSAAQEKSNKTMKYVQWGMTIFIVIMGFTLPSAMGVYWLAGALFSILQTIIMHFIFEKKYGNNRK